jgi:anti-sigma regulatory factor (Ser/Thr protein kinase)
MGRVVEESKVCTSVMAEAVSPVVGVEVKLCPMAKSVQVARDFVREHLAKWGFPQGAEDGPLVTSELATNAIEHAPKTPFFVSVRIANGWPLVEVADCSPKMPVLSSGGHLSTCGRGLHIVDALSVAWDSYPVAGGKVVWVQLSPE